MNSTTDTARTEAHTWFARLQAHDCSAEDRARFERWRAADARHADAYADLEDVWELSAELAREDTAIAAAVRDARRADTRPWLSRHRWSLMTAAASLLVSGWWLNIALQPPKAPAFHYVTAPGEPRTFILEDGSLVVLDTDTRLDVRYDRDQRSVVLQQGRVDFKVHKDPTHPFVVKAGLADVTATGTQFQIRLDGGAGQVTLLEGQVVVASRQSAGKATLAPGDRVAVDAAGTLGVVQRLSDADRANAEGWTVGQLVVKEWPLETLVAEVNRYGRTPLRLGDAGVGRLPVSGTFDPAAPESLALALQYGWPVRVEQGKGEIVLYARK